MKLIYGYTQQVHELAERYIEREILCNDTMLVEELFDILDTSKKTISEAFDYENVENIYNVSPDWINNYLTDEQRTALSKAGYTTMEDFSDYFEECEVELTEQEKTLLEDLLNEWNHRDNKSPEIYEWYRVTKWLGKKLIDIGQPVLCNDYGHWWGRTCTGQAIILDGTIQEIAKEYL